MNIHVFQDELAILIVGVSSPTPLWNEGRSVDTSGLDYVLNLDEKSFNEYEIQLMERMVNELQTAITKGV